MKRYENFIEGKFVQGDQEGQRISVFQSRNGSRDRAGP